MAEAASFNPSREPSTVHRALQLTAFLVDYTDGDGHSQVRIVFRSPVADDVFILTEKVTGTALATKANPWFEKGLTALLRGSQGLESV